MNLDGVILELMLLPRVSFSFALLASQLFAKSRTRDQVAPCGVGAGILSERHREILIE